MFMTGAIVQKDARIRSAAPKFIDVAVDLGLGDGMILNVRQPYGLPKETTQGKGGGDRQGTYVWPASTDLGRFLTSEKGRMLVQGRRVVELGAGTSIAGLSAALAGAEQIVFTDGSQGAQEADVGRKSVLPTGCIADRAHELCVLRARVNIYLECVRPSVSSPVSVSVSVSVIF